MGLCVNALALQGAPAPAHAPAMAMAMAPACLCVAAQRYRPHSFRYRYLHGARLWPSPFVRSSGTWTVPASEGAASSKRRARGPVMAAAKKAAGEGQCNCFSFHIFRCKSSLHSFSQLPEFHISPRNSIFAFFFVASRISTFSSQSSRFSKIAGFFTFLGASRVFAFFVTRSSL